MRLSDQIRYEGRRLDGRAHVVVLDGPSAVGELPPRHDLRSHSPDGFEWGYGGSGSAQLALALCAHALGDDRRAEVLYQQFKWQVVARLEGDWSLTRAEVLAALDRIAATPV